MRYDVTAFEVKPGQKISVTIKNVGTTPKFSMGHNFVLLDRTMNTGNVHDVSRQRLDGGVARLRSARRQGSARAHQTARAWRKRHRHVQRAFVPGEYLYLCSFPGHYSQGTKGFMTVK